MDHWEDWAVADHLPFIDENLELARKYGGDSKIVALLKRARRRRQRRDKLLDFFETSLRPLHPVLLPIAHRIRPSSGRIHKLVVAMENRKTLHA
jgi:hypothetical protein